MPARTLTTAERQFLFHPPSGALARLATVDSAGLPHVVPVGWSFDPGTDQLILGGRDVPGTRRARHVEDTGVAAVSIDGLSHAGDWAPWALLARGRAVLDHTERAIRLSCDQVTSWGLDGAGARSGSSGHS